MKRILFSVCLAVVAVLTASADGLIAFPGAEGYGRFAKGARAGTAPTVYHVTNLKDSGTGSLRDAVSQPNRVIVFDVSGIIKLESQLVFSKNLTIAGQTAPGNGIVIYGKRTSFSAASNVIVRYLRIRMGIGGDGQKDATGISNGTNMIFDHCSVTWGRDETFSINPDGKGDLGNITIQNSIIGQGLTPHSAGGLCQCWDGGVTLFRNLYIDNKTRNPKVKGINQYINNVVYNWGSGGSYIAGGDSEGQSWADIQYNLFMRGPLSSGTGIGGGNTLFAAYLNGNKNDLNCDGVFNSVDMTESDYGTLTIAGSLDELALVDGYPTDNPHPAISAMIPSADDAFAWVLDSVGAVLPDRDEVDQYIINEVKTYGVKGNHISDEGALNLTDKVGHFYTGTKPLDSDNDGMPDEWETANGLNPNDASDNVKYAENGYLNIENYINSIVAPHDFLKYPVDVTLATLGTDSVTISFSCFETAPEAKVVVELALADSGEYAAVSEIATSEKLAVIKGLTQKTAYKARLKIVVGDTEAVSAELEFTTKGEPGEPDLSTNPYPADGETLTEYTTVTLSFSNTTTGRPQYFVYMGTSPDALDSIAMTRAKSYTIAVEQNTTYYWRIDASNTFGYTTGDVWSFTTGSEPVRVKVAYFDFDETSGSTAVNRPTDDEIIANDATPNGSYAPQWGEGRIAGAISFSGASATDAMVVPCYDEINFADGAFTYELWFKSTSGSSSQSRYLLHKGSHVASATASGKWFGLEYKNGKLYFAVDDDVTKSVIEYASTSYFDGNWHYVVAVRDVENAKLLLYIDGALKASGDDKTGSIEASEAFVVGNCNVNFDSPFIGAIDNLALYNEALTAVEIAAKYQEGLSSAIGEVTAENTTMVVSPSSFDEQFTIALPQGVTGNVTVELHNPAGALMYEAAWAAEGGVITVSGLDNLAAGVYTCSVTAGDVVRTARVIKY